MAEGEDTQAVRLGTPVSASLTQNSTESPKTKSKSSNLFQNALQTWTEIDLASLQKKLDDQGIELKDEQKTSLLSRKNLAAKTKEFKKLPDDVKLQDMKSLLKLYQNEIDSLTNKQKKVENYFFGFYRLIAEAPDPRPLLELSLDAVVDSSETNNFKKEIAKLNEELSKKADYDQLKQRLLRNEQKSAELLSSKLQSKEEELKAIIDEKESNWANKESNFESQLNEYKNKIEELRTSKEVTELQLNSQNKQIGDNNSNISASALAELEIVSRDAESAKKRVIELEKRNESLRSELSRSQNDAERKQLREELTKKISELEGENALLVADLNQTKNKLELISKENDSKIHIFNREISQLTLEVKNLKVRIDQTNDYEEIKHELHLMRQIEFGQDDEEVIENGEYKQIDSLLIERNKNLTQELADYRSQHEDLNKRITALDEDLIKTKEELTKAYQLNNKLENDLSDLQDASNNKFNDNMSLVSGVSRMTRPFGREGSLPNIGGEESSILPIITKQRDRFRDKNNELEDEVRKQYGVISDLKRQMNSLKKDNEELYERTRYLASFKNNNNNSNLFTPVASQSFSSRTSNRKLLDPSPSNNVDLESNTEYQDNYESKLHPIEQFRKRERERINSRLSPIERLFISLTRAILATRTTRMLFMAYCFGLHCIVMFITIYAMSLSTQFMPEVGLNSSTGGVANGMPGSPDTPGNVGYQAPSS
ncbi:hypothetical protein HYPBUDRAFT_145749 [Hyphopichia burtonii NRRL Y-1933]|uniref:Protein CASP n=1 Tax=Hyphopichia burtonii NRRL Y-1933 TaxID=984485 RepID=A0A1E4RQ38_9ASCO|nr:hypothetical protein HYPBUDRAFT_145749 [Hyphopichia burtonii NRRL Y-1933]ODV69321.1 hypothetical protein HYPBUDRAFT_145749 [Hyphopichia burtonii NRRL Y-1933]